MTYRCATPSKSICRLGNCFPGPIWKESYDASTCPQGFVWFDRIHMMPDDVIAALFPSLSEKEQRAAKKCVQDVLPAGYAAQALEAISSDESTWAKSRSANAAVLQQAADTSKRTSARIIGTASSSIAAFHLARVPIFLPCARAPSQNEACLLIFLIQKAAQPTKPTTARWNDRKKNFVYSGKRSDRDNAHGRAKHVDR
jgi:hypothetical protein